MPSSVKMASKSAMRSYISWKHLHSNGYPGWRVKSKWAWIGRIQGTGNETAGGRGLGEVNGVCGAGSSHPGASQITLGEQLPTGGLWSPKGWDSCFREGLTLLFSSVLIHVPHDTALAIRSEGWDVGCTVDSGSSHLALGLVTFGRKLCLQMAVLFCCGYISQTLSVGTGRIHSINTQLNQTHPLSSSPPCHPQSHS